MALAHRAHWWHAASRTIALSAAGVDIWSCYSLLSILLCRMRSIARWNDSIALAYIMSDFDNCLINGRSKTSCLFTRGHISTSRRFVVSCILWRDSHSFYVMRKAVIVDPKLVQRCVYSASGEPRGLAASPPFISAIRSIYTAIIIRHTAMEPWTMPVSQSMRHCNYMLPYIEM